MKVNKRQADFTPVELTITIESQREIVTLAHQLDVGWNLLHNEGLHTLAILVTNMREALLRGGEDEQ